MGTKRAVQLTAEGRETFTTALNERWQTQFPGKRQTREARAEFLHLSIATTQKLLDGQPVDKSTIQLAFQRLDLPWDDIYCTKSLSPQLPEPTVNHEPKRHWRQRWLMSTGIGGLCLLAAVLIWYSARSTPQGAVVEPWRYKLDRLLFNGTKDFQEGRYSRAEQQIQAAYSIALDRDLAGATAENLRMLGDIAAAKGQLEQARINYLESLQIRHQNLRLSTGTLRAAIAKSIPPLMEAIGVVETRLHRWKEAEMHLNEALTGYREQKVPSGVAMSLRGLGTLSYERGHYERALQLFDQALRSLDPKDKQSDLAYDIHARKALASGRRGDGVSALQTLDRCLAHWKERGHIRWQAETKLQIAQVSLWQNRRVEAVATLSSALSQFEEVGDTENARIARELRAKAAN